MLRSTHSLEGVHAGDLITCRPFDASLKLIEKGYLAPLNDLPGWKTSAMLPNQRGLLMLLQCSVYLWLQLFTVFSTTKII
jgi:hypothetical protein